MSMSPEVPRWFASVLSDASTGVNARRASLPKRITDAVPPSVAIYNAMDNKLVAQGTRDDEATPDQWVLMIKIGLDFTLAGDPRQSGDGQDTSPLVLHVQGVTAEGNNATAAADALRILRLARRCVLEAFAALRGDALVLDEQRIELPLEWTQLTLAPKEGAGTVDLALVIPLLITDPWAFGARV